MTKFVMELPISSHEPVSVTRKKNCGSESQRRGERWMRRTHVDRQNLGENRADEEEGKRREAEMVVDRAGDGR